MSTGLVPDVGPAFPVVLPVGKPRGAGAAALLAAAEAPGAPTREEDDAVKDLAEAGARADAGEAGEAPAERPGEGGEKAGEDAEKPPPREKGEEAEAAMWKALSEILRTRMHLQARAAERPPVAGLNVSLVPVTAADGLPPAGPGLGMGALPPPLPMPVPGMPLPRGSMVTAAEGGDWGMPPIASTYAGARGAPHWTGAGFHGLGRPELLLLGPCPGPTPRPEDAAWRPFRRRSPGSRLAPSVRAFL
mmetsp:Transcript_4004/g.8136  ORF Transcript_4004/g.8136 Transcript_4004/m.8136 type:complete len:247 (-) Transcript_4004:139-879(-)